MYRCSNCGGDDGEHLGADMYECGDCGNITDEEGCEV